MPLPPASPALPANPERPPAAFCTADAMPCPCYNRVLYFYGSGAMHYRSTVDRQEARETGGDLSTPPIMLAAAMWLVAGWLSLAQPAGAAAPGADTLGKIRSTRTIVLGHRTASIPFSYLPGTISRPIGYSIAICEHIVDAVKANLHLPELRVQYHPVQPDNRMAMVASGSVDVECGSTTATPERRKEVDFSTTTFVAATRVAVVKGGPLRALRDLNGHRIAVTRGTTNEQVMEQVARERKLDVQLVRGRDHDASYAAFRSGKADAVAMDDILLLGLMTEAGEQGKIEFMDETLSSEPYAIMLRKNDPEFKALVDKAINEMIDHSEMAKLYQQWFRSPIPPKRANLALPFTEEMARVLKLVR